MTKNALLKILTQKDFTKGHELTICEKLILLTVKVKKMKNEEKNEKIRTRQNDHFPPVYF